MAKSLSKSLKAAAPTPEMKNRRIVEVTLRIPLAEDARRVTLHDIRRTAAAAGASARTVLEGATPAYSIDGDVDVTHRYSIVYEQVQQSL